MKLFEEYRLYETMWKDNSCKGADCKKDLKEDARLANHRVVLADYDTDDFDINVDFGMQDPEENEVVDYEYLLKPGQTAGDLVVWLSRDCGYTSIYVHDERPATPDDIKRLASDTFPVTGTGDEWSDYGDLDEAKTEEPKEPLTEARSVAEIKAEIRALMTELRDAERAERAATATSIPTAVPTTPVSKAESTSVWTWDIYLTPEKKGTWTGIQNDLVFETKDKALDAAWTLLNELDDEGELEYDPDDYYVEAFEIPISSVSKEVLSFSNLNHLI